MSGTEKKGTGRDDLLRYLAGEMTNSERNAFEKELQRDPFAEDAAEGLSLIDSEEVRLDLEQLDVLVSAKPVRKMRMFYSGVAAVLLVLVISSVLFFRTGRDTTSEIAMMAGEEKTEIKTSPLSETEPFTSDKGAALPVDTVKLIAAAETAEKKISEPAAERVISRTEDTTRAVGGVQNLKISTDPEIKRIDEVVVVAYGEQRKAAVAATLPTKAIDRLAADVSLKGGIAELIPRDSTGDPFYTPPLPAGGFAEFQEYLNKNMRQPLAEETATEKIVEIDLPVSATGEKATPIIIKSPGEAFTAEAKRLLSGGPQWIPATRHDTAISDTVRIRIKFGR